MPHGAHHQHVGFRIGRCGHKPFQRTKTTALQSHEARFGAMARKQMGKFNARLSGAQFLIVADGDDDDLRRASDQRQGSMNSPHRSWACVPSHQNALWQAGKGLGRRCQWNRAPGIKNGGVDQDLCPDTRRAVKGKDRQITDAQMISKGLSIAIGEAGALPDLARDLMALCDSGQMIGTGVFKQPCGIIRRAWRG